MVRNYFLMQKYQFDHMSAKKAIGEDGDANCKLYDAADNSGDKIMAIYNSGAAGDLTLTLNGWVLKKLAVSTDFKKLDVNGWATESRARVIDPALTSYLTGNNIETIFVTDINYNEKLGAAGTLTLAYPDTNEKGNVLMANTDDETGACMLHNAGEQKGPVEILNGGFHLFVPDMHDYTVGSNSNEKTLTTAANSLLVAQVNEGYVPAVNGSCTNYVLTSTYYDHDTTLKTLDDDAFYRIKGNSVHSIGNQAYLPLLTAKVAPSTSGSSIGFFFEGYQPVDGISEVSTDAVTTINAYTIGGQKLQSLPKTSGIYIINGKKVVIK